MPNFIAQSATVVGKVSLGEDSSVWYLAVIRADVEEIIIGNALISKMEQFCTLILANQPSLVMTLRLVTEQSFTVQNIGDGTLIGMRSTILNRAKIGKHCIIGACALVTEGMEIPDYSMVLGVPAKIVKQLPAEYAEKLQLSAAHYVEMAKRHQTGEFKPI
jgi:carbonic anhydrase/acetyltransferase-like protein (isoleucine patch superfamily)